MMGAAQCQVESFPVLDLAGEWNDVLVGPARRVLQEQVLPAFLRSQRWFGGKARPIEHVRLLDWGTLTHGPATRAWLALFEVRFVGGTTDLYHLPLAVTTGAGTLLRSSSARFDGKSNRAKPDHPITLKTSTL